MTKPLSRFDRAEVLRQLKKVEQDIEHIRFLLKPRNGGPSRASVMREIEVGEYRDFTVKNSLDAASVRSTAYQEIGRRGCARCERISSKAVRVHRLK